ncbi:hypothetical protein B0H13DRAFT_2422068 [Mycena leptocephala]|nr:hypothetical protein B0H13DRAFT_2484196 [Mycena leptocephala]KAJ7837153.1 hypothetical protein B0H13DRAFT_2422068 [Mycena leptocephala]
MSDESTPLVLPQAQRHPDFYFLDGKAIFSLKAGEAVLLYNLHPSILGSRSTFFQSMFSLPRGLTASTQVLSEGTIDENPIQLPSTITQFDFDNLLIYLYKGPSVHPKTNEFLVSVLALSTFFGIDDGVSHAIAEFTRPGNKFDAALQFQLARCYRVDDWIEPAFRKLVELSIDSITMDHMDQIGPDGFFQLIKTKEELLTVRRQFAFHVPPVVNHGECENPAYCGVAWAREWRENVPRFIHHPDKPSGCVNLLNDLRLADIENLCKLCQELSVTWLWGKGWSAREEEKIEEGIAALMSLQTGSPFRATLRDGTRVESVSE